MENTDNSWISRKKKTPASIVDLQHGRIPPQAIDFEEAVLGAILIDHAAINQVIDVLNPQSFYKKQHQVIFKVIKELFSKNQPIDLLTVTHELRSKSLLGDSGGEVYLVQLSQRVSSSAHSEFHARIIVQKHLQRKMIQVASKMINRAFDETTDVFELLDESERELFEVAHGNIVKNYESADQLIREVIHRMEEISKKEGLSGIPSGFTKIDRVTAGWQPSDLIILAARTSMGKTAFVLSMTRNIVVDHKIPVVIFSLEMSSVQLITRLISSETGLSSQKLKKGDLNDHEWQQLLTKVKSLEKAPLYIDDTPALSVFELRAKCRRLLAQHQVKLIIVDYLQLMTIGGQRESNRTREQEVGQISRSLKNIAKELQVPVIAVSQLSRAVETRGGTKRPLLSDLRESGAIEQDADIVSFIYRPEYYDLFEWEDGSPCQGQAEFMISKHRNGSLENVKLRFYKGLAKFSDLGEKDDFEPMVFESKMNTDRSLDDDYESHEDRSF